METEGRGHYGFSVPPVISVRRRKEQEGKREGEGEREEGEERQGRRGDRKGGRGVRPHLTLHNHLDNIIYNTSRR